jgi:hypothetical protein
MKRASDSELLDWLGDAGIGLFEIEGFWRCELFCGCDGDGDTPRAALNSALTRHSGKHYSATSRRIRSKKGAKDV